MPSDPEGMVGELTRMLGDRGAPILNVTIHATGALIPRGSEDRILHWVRIIGIETADDGTTGVSIYNSYTNSRMTYSAVDLAASSLETVVVGTPSGETAAGP